MELRITQKLAEVGTSRVGHWSSFAENEALCEREILKIKGDLTLRLV